MESMGGELIMDLVTNAPFLAYMIWQSQILRKEAKEIRHEAKEEREQCKKDMELARQRWQDVVAKLDSERTLLMQNIDRKIDLLDQKTSNK
jgi:hypothetical protein